MRYRGQSLAALLLALGCAEQPDTTGGGDAACAGKCDSADEEPLPESVCIVDHSGRGFLPQALADDPLFSRVWEPVTDAADCPRDYPSIVEALLAASPDCALETAVVSERGHMRSRLGIDPEQPEVHAPMRTVTMVQCDVQTMAMLSLFGFSTQAQGELHPEGDGFPSGVELISTDVERGVFNYYKEVQGELKFFGTSDDFVTRGPGGGRLTDERGCANCHTGGGPIMKELQTPWVHWEGISIAGGATIGFQHPFDPVVFRPSFGEKSNGQRLENAVLAAIDLGTPARIETMRASEEPGATQALLRPLFCPVEVNVETASVPQFGFGGFGPTNLGLTHKFFVDGTGHQEESLRGLGMQIPLDTYLDVLDRVQSEVLVDLDLDPPMRDLAAPLTHIVPGAADKAYVKGIVGPVVSEGLALDIRMVDFTRPLFSPDRCELLAAVPELAVDDRNPEEIEARLLAGLRNIDTAAARELIANIEREDDAAEHGAAVQAFGAACQTRTDDGKATPEFTLDILKMRALQRKIAMRDGSLCRRRGMPDEACLDDDPRYAPLKVFEFADSIPFDAVAVTREADPEDALTIHPDARWHPDTCELTDALTPRAE